MNFLEIRFLDILDIFLVAYLLYQVYMLIRGTVAINIFMGIFLAYLVWLIVKALNMELLSNILGQVMGVSVIALIVVFQQEIRRFLLLIGTRYFSNKNFSLEYLFSIFIKSTTKKNVRITPIVSACEHLSKHSTGALIVIAKNSKLGVYTETGELINAETSSRLLETIFFKNSPLHDGAAIVVKDKLVAAGCVLPVSPNQDLPKNLGLRHRAALGMSETTDSFVIVVSEETGNISYAQLGNLHTDITPRQLKELLKESFYTEKQAAASWQEPPTKEDNKEVYVSGV